MSEKGKIYKSGLMDKWDAHMPNKAGWFHDDYMVSSEQVHFHLPNSYQSHAKGRGWSAGINKKIYRASPYGICVDREHVGKTEQ